ncbi:MAG TPA: hypothetical protein VFE14_10670, partial [Micromonosporaceae bacterium]|nr:hypothetical protein [Micromonosporaceae bacterium]
GAVQLAMVGIAEWRIHRKQRAGRVRELPRHTAEVAGFGASGFILVGVVAGGVWLTILLVAAYAAIGVALLALAGEVRAKLRSRARGDWLDDEAIAPVADIRAIARGHRRGSALGGAVTGATDRDIGDRRHPVGARR